MKYIEFKCTRGKEVNYDLRKTEKEYLAFKKKKEKAGWVVEKIAEPNQSSK